MFLLLALLLKQHLFNLLKTFSIPIREASKKKSLHSQFCWKLLKEEAKKKKKQNLCYLIEGRLGIDDMTPEKKKCMYFETNAKVNTGKWKKL